tara:strand:+ start:8766 stop:9221 length:456 start_codon:yes stop_codon:yes gene_type:complete
MMYNDDIISQEDHQGWFERVTSMDDRVCFIFEEDGEPRGVVNASQRLEETNTWIWGCYLGDPGVVPGLGTKMGLFAMQQFFEEMKMGIVIGEMIKSNDVSYRFNRKLGFREVKELSVPRGNGEMVDSILFVQTDHDWLAQRTQLLKNAGLA